MSDQDRQKKLIWQVLPNVLLRLELHLIREEVTNLQEKMLTIVIDQ